MILSAIQGVNRSHNSVLQILDRFKVVVVNSRTFKMAPKPFNEIQIGSIRRIPDDRQMMALGRQICLDGFRMVDRAVVEEQIDMVTVGINVFGQPLQERQELNTAFSVRDQSGHLARDRIQSPKHRNTTVLSGRGYKHASTARAPATRKPRIQVELGFVTVEKRQTTSTGSGFFKARDFCRLARATSLEFCRWAKSSFGCP